MIEEMIYSAPIDTDMDGIPDYKDQCKKTPARSIVNHEGCSLIQNEQHENFVDEVPMCTSAVCPLGRGHGPVIVSTDGTVFPDEQQRLNAVKAAPSGQDEALEAPASPIFLKTKPNDKSIRDFF